MARYRTEFRRVVYLPDCDGKTVVGREYKAPAGATEGAEETAKGEATMKSDDEPPPIGEPLTLTPWTHPTTGGRYLVFGVATCSTNGDRAGVERSVVYWSFKKRDLRYREIGEFLDGRFEEDLDV